MNRVEHIGRATRQSRDPQGPEAASPVPTGTRPDLLSFAEYEQLEAEDREEIARLLDDWRAYRPEAWAIITLFSITILIAVVAGVRA